MAEHGLLSAGLPSARGRTRKHGLVDEERETKTAASRQLARISKLIAPDVFQVTDDVYGKPETIVGHP